MDRIKLKAYEMECVTGLWAHHTEAQEYINQLQQAIDDLVNEKEILQAIINELERDIESKS